MEKIFFKKSDLAIMWSSPDLAQRAVRAAKQGDERWVRLVPGRAVTDLLIVAASVPAGTALIEGGHLPPQYPSRLGGGSR